MYPIFSKPHEGLVADFYSESIEMFRLVVPMMFLIFSQVVMSFFSILMFARISVPAIAAGGLGLSVYATVFITCATILSAIGVAVSNIRGSGQLQNVAGLARQGFYVAMFLSLPGLTILLRFDALFRFAGFPDDVRLLVNEYVRACAWALPAGLGSVVLREYAFALGRLRIIFLLGLFLLPLHMLTTYIFMFGIGDFPGLGVIGAAWAVVLVSWMGFFIMIAYALLLERDMLLSATLRPVPRLLSMLLRIGPAR